MTPEPRKTRTDADGVKIAPVAGVRSGVWLIALAAVLVGAAGLIALRVALRADATELEAAQSSDPAVAAVAAAPSAPAPAPAAPAAPSARPVRREAAPPAPLPPGSTQAPRPEPPSLPEVPDDASGGSSGIALYPPMGTDPPKVGLLVPEDFELPEGYVRHYQATDDGEQLPAILMFHPDFVWLDENGNQIPLPPDRIVPPEMAPPGLPRDFIEVPPPRPDEAPPVQQGAGPAIPGGDTPSPDPAP